MQFNAIIHNARILFTAILQTSLTRFAFNRHFPSIYEKGVCKYVLKTQITPQHQNQDAQKPIFSEVRLVDALQQLWAQ